MKKITTLLCGVAVVASLSTSALAGGKSTTGAPTTAPTPVAASTLRVSLHFYGQRSSDVTSTAVADLLAAYRTQIAALNGISEDRVNVQGLAAQ